MKETEMKPNKSLKKKAPVRPLPIAPPGTQTQSKHIVMFTEANIDVESHGAFNFFHFHQRVLFMSSFNMITLQC